MAGPSSENGGVRLGDPTQTGRSRNQADDPERWLGAVGPLGTKVLAEATGLLAASYDESHFLRDFVRFAVQDLSTWTMVYLVDRDGRIRRVQAAHRDTNRERLLTEILAYPPLEATAPHHPVPRAIAQGRGALVTDMGALAIDGHHRGILRKLGDGHALVAPLRARGRVLGAMVLASTTRPYGEADVDLAETLGRLAGLGLDNARLFAGEQAARRDAERAATRIARLQGVTAALAEALTPHDVAGVAIRDVVAAAGATDGVVILRDATGALEVLASTGGMPTSERIEPRETSPLGEALRTGVAAFAPPDGPGGRPLPSCVVPIVLQGKVVGALSLNFRDKTEFTLEERTFLEALARQCAHALERAQLFAAEQRARGEAESSLAALRDSEARYRLIADNSLDIISRFAPDGTTLYVSPACRRVLGYEPGDIIGEPFTALIHPEDLPRVARTPQALLGSRDTYSLTYRQRRKDKEYVWMEMTARGLRDAKGDLIEVVAIARDISERRRAEEEMEAGRRQVARSEKLSALGSLVSGVAHEIRTPLAYLTNNLFLIQTRLARAAQSKKVDFDELLEEVKRLSDEALEGTDRINTLVRDLGRFTRPPTGGRTRARLDVVVGEAVRLFQATHRGQVVVESALQPTREVEVDAVQAQQVVLNLLDNAADAVAPGGRVYVATQDVRDGVTLVVEDDGPGIASDVQARMFDPFFTTKREGTGLGLSIVRRIVEAHAATLTCESAPGEGTRFVIRFPPVDGPAQAAADAPA